MLVLYTVRFRFQKGKMNSTGKCGKTFHSHAMQIILNVKNFFTKEKENGAPIVNVLQQTAEATGVSKVIISRICQQNQSLRISTLPAVVVIIIIINNIITTTTTICNSGQKQAMKIYNYWRPGVDFFDEDVT